MPSTVAEPTGLKLALVRAVRTKPIPTSLACSGAAGGQLRRCLKLRDIIGFGLGATVGGGIFVATGAAVLEAGPSVVLSFLLAALGCAASGLCYAEMSTLVPSAGSSYSFTYTAIGELAACCVGITNIAGNVLSGAAVARGWASYFCLLLVELGFQPWHIFMDFEIGGLNASPMAFLLVVFVSVVNLFGTKATSALNGGITFVSLVLLLGFIAGGTSVVDPNRWNPFMPEGLSGVLRGSGTVFFAYLGFDVLACLGEEAEDPKVVPQGILATLAISTALYCATAITFTGMVTIQEVEVAAPLAAAARLRGLNVVALFIAIGAVGNTVTTVVGAILGAPRVCYVMAQDGLLPAGLAKVSATGTPTSALLLTAVPTALLAGLMDFEALAEIVSAGALCSFSSVCCSLVILRNPQDRAVASWTRAPCPRAAGGVSGSDAASPYPSVVGASVYQGPSMMLPDAPPPQLEPARCCSPGICMALYGCLCLLMGLLLRACSLAESSHAASATLMGACLSALGAAFAALLVARPFVHRLRQRGSKDMSVGDDSDEEDSGANGARFRLAAMPLVPLLAVFVNMVLLSMLSLPALWRSLGIYGACAVFYLCYSGPRSRLNDVEEIPLVDAEFDDRSPTGHF